MSMRLILGLLLTAVLLAGCGDDTSSTAKGDPTAPTTPTATDDGEFWSLVTIVTEPAVGGRIDERAVDLTDDAALDEFLAQFEDARMDEALRQAIATADVDAGQALVGAVVGVGCLPPTGVTVKVTDRGLMITGIPDKREATVDCFAATTSVALVTLDADLL